MGPDRGSCGVSGNRVRGGKQQEFGLREIADEERREDEEEQGRSHINSVLVQPSISLLGAKRARRGSISRDVGKISLRPGQFVVCSRRC